MSRVPLAELPARYRQPDVFYERLRRLLSAASRVVEIGPGDKPCVEASAVSVYAAIEPSEGGGRAEDHRPELVGRFDLAVARDVFEHFDDTAVALRNIRSYLEPDGKLLAYLSAKWSVHSVANNVIPEPLGRRLVRREEPKFPARYDRCTYRDLAPLLADWESASVTPLYLAAEYFSFSAPVERAYLLYESRVATRCTQLATHLLIEATA